MTKVQISSICQVARNEQFIEIKNNFGNTIRLNFAVIQIYTFFIFIRPPRVEKHKNNQSIHSPERDTTKSTATVTHFTSWHCTHLNPADKCYHAHEMRRRASRRLFPVRGQVASS